MLKQIVLINKITKADEVSNIKKIKYLPSNF